MVVDKRFTLALVAMALVAAAVFAMMRASSSPSDDSELKAQVGRLSAISEQLQSASVAPVALITPPTMQTTAASTESSQPCPKPMAAGTLPTPIEPFRKREHLGSILQSECDAGMSMHKGIELGVQRGHFAKEILSRWKCAQEYHLVDIWKHLENYKDVANHAQPTQNEFFKEALASVEPWKEKISVCRDFTTSCVKHYKDEYFDYIYVDARHDFKGVAVDLHEWWPKLRPGGIMAGHDFVEQSEVWFDQDWTVNYDGTIDESKTVVRGAVLEFTNKIGRQVVVSYQEANWHTWAIRK